MCFVRGLNLCVLAISNAPMLSSKTLQCTFAFSSVTSNTFAFISFRSSMIGMASLRAYESPVYSDSVELEAISVCS